MAPGPPEGTKRVSMEHAYGRGEPFRVGIEEELLLVDPVTRMLVPDAERVLSAVEAPEGAAGHEAFAAEVELRSPPCDTVAGAVASLRATRTALAAAGGTLLGAGVHPAGRYGDAELTDQPRYREVGATMRGLLRRTPDAALHVHVGMPDPESAIRACNGLRAHLPVLHALGAASPWWFGRDSGLASARHALVRAYPRRGVPRAFRDFEDYAATVAAVLAAGELEEYTYIWWDVRPHPRLGTIEVREMDAQSRLEDASALAALVQSLARHEAEGRGSADAAAEPTEAIAESCFRASRDGLGATILSGGRLRPVREVAQATLAAVEPVARELGCEDELKGVERILREGGAAARHRAAHERGGIEALLAMLVEETAG